MGERKIILACLILVTTTFHLIKDEYEAYLSNIIDMIKASPGVMDVLDVKEFPDIFLDELPGLPPYQKVDFEIKTIPEAAH